MAVIIPPMKKQTTANQLLAANWRVPLSPWPLVHPFAQREPNPIKTPPANAEITRQKAEPPNASTHFAGVHIQTKSPHHDLHDF